MPTGKINSTLLNGQIIYIEPCRVYNLSSSQASFFRTVKSKVEAHTFAYGRMQALIGACIILLHTYSTFSGGVL